MSHTEEVRQRRAQLATARHRPRYHYLPPANWMNDPNGVIYWRGRYHLFYQYNPHGPRWGDIHWGHAVSDDLVHWQDLPVALTPTPGGADEGGCWSGCAVDHDGVPTIFYTGIRGDHSLGQNQRICMATGSDDLLQWRKHAANPVVLPPDDLDLVGFRDPSVWREGNTWYGLVGAGVRDVGGAVLLYKTDDLARWTLLGKLLEGDKHSNKHSSTPLWTGSVWECPQLLPFGEQYALIFGVFDTRAYYTAYTTGVFRDERFTATTTRRLDYGDHYFYAAQTLTDHTGRQVMFGWIPEGSSQDAQTAGWAGVMSLPRVVSLHDDTLCVQPAPELQRLRHAHTRRDPFAVTAAVEPWVGQGGEQLELLVTFCPTDDRPFGLVVCRSPGGEEETRIFYDPRGQRLGVERGGGGITATPASQHDIQQDVQQGAFALRPGEPLTLRVFIDHSVLEVFANGRQCITSRVYPQRTDSQGVGVFAQGKTWVESLELWRLRSIWV